MLDYFGIDRSLVVVAAYIQDRFLETKAGKVAQSDRTLFRVVSVTSLYIAIKLRVPHKWNVTSHAFARLCQGTVSGDEINDMEHQVLFALRWNVNPPIPQEYSELYMDLIFNIMKDQMMMSSSSSSERYDLQHSPFFSPIGESLHERVPFQYLRDRIRKLVRYQLDIVVWDIKLSSLRSSLLATAAVMNALEGLLNESTYNYHESAQEATFCREAMGLILGTMTSCKIASDVQLEYVRSLLLDSVLSLEEDEKGFESSRSAAVHGSDVPNCTEPPSPRGATSSPTSASRFWSNKHTVAATPQSILSKVFVFHQPL